MKIQLNKATLSNIHLRIRDITIVLALVVGTAPANACIGKAQIAAKTSSVVKHGYFSCVAYIDVGSVQYFKAEPSCPLSMEQILKTGIEVGIKEGHDCALDIGDTISGTLSLTEAGKIELN